MAKRNREKGQALPILVIAFSLVLVGGMGLAINAGNLYQHTQLAQVAADAAATAGITSMFQGVDVTGAPHYFSTAGSFNCTVGSDTKLPCVYARMNGFGLTSADTVTVDFPTCTGSPDPCGYQSKLSTTITPNQIRVTITRTARNSIIQMFGAGTTTAVRATATAAIVEVQSPTPIIITHPTKSQSLSLNGTTTLQICGGPSRSIQVNSSSPTAFNPSNGTVDLSRAGPDGAADCSKVAGANFGVFGGDYTNPGEVVLGSGVYLSRSSPVPDPFAGVPFPGVPGNAPAVTTIGTGQHGCIQSSCKYYQPGLYTGGLATGNNYVIFAPGLYYVRGNSSHGVDFTQTKGGGTNFNAMCTDCASVTDYGTGVMFYDTGAAGSTFGSDASGGFTVGTQAQLVLTGPTLTTTNAKGETVPAAPYYNILFFEDRNADAHTGNASHVMGTGNGCFTMNKASLYITNTRDDMLAHPTHYQAVDFAGTPCSGTVNQGDIIVGTLTVKGNSTIIMNLVPTGFLYLDQVALVGGGPHP